MIAAALSVPPLTPNLLQDALDLWSFDFMRHALVAGAGIAVAAGLVGYFVVLRNQVFTSDALGHVAFTGGMGGLLAGLPLLPSVFGASAAGSLAMGSLGGRGRGRDVAIGTVFAWVMGLGVLCLRLYTTARSGAGGIAGTTVLFGSMLSLTASQAATAAWAGVAIAAVLLAICRPLLFASVDPDVAVTRGAPVRLVGAVFLILVGATVAEAVQAVGALLIFALLVTPAAIAQNLTARPYLGLLLSAVIAVAVVWLGLALAFYIRGGAWPVSFFITALAFAGFTASALWSRRGQR